MKAFLSTLLFALATSAAQAQTPNADGVVEKVDVARERITLKHGEIKNLEMMAMTMTFRVKDKAWLAELQAGDKVRFAAEKLNGQYTVVAIEKLK